MKVREQSHDKTVQTGTAAFHKGLIPFLTATQRSTSVPSSLSLPVRYIRMLLWLGKTKGTYLGFTPQETPEKPREPEGVAALPQDIDLSLSVLRRLKWNSLYDEVSDGGGDQVDHGDEIGHVPVTSGSGASCLEETVEALESCVGVP